MEKLFLLIIGVLSSTTIMAQDCPAHEGFGACIETCTDNSDCTNGQICCSNGCGQQCMTPVVDPCANVSCAAPNCHELSAGTITSEGECCPVCACTATDGSMVAAGTSFMNDCNTCSCGSTGLAACTLIACSPTTEPTASTPTTTIIPTTDVTPSVGPTDPNCPAPEGFGTCVSYCTDNSNCTNGQICCSNGCGGQQCMTPVVDPCATVPCPLPNCHELSPGTITPEGECCPVCACTATDGSMVAAGTSFMNDCNTCSCGSTGLAGCTRRACLPTTEPTTSTSTTATTTLPTSSPTVMCPNVTNLGGTCDERCSSDDGCSNGQLCCSNGCGHACMDPVVDCAAVSCLRPTCESPSVLVTPEGSCCPVCGCPTPNGDGVAPGESYHPDSCNTCICSENGLAACTLAFCPPPTGTSTTPTTDITPNVGPTDPTCPIGGQIRVGCASPCSITCANVDTVMICPTVCVTNGCQCPRGTVIDEQSNNCVSRSDCPSNYTAPPPRPSGCTASDGTSVGVGETYMDQCNTCRCLEGGVGACTRRACIGCTLADGSWVAIGETYKKDCNTCTCTDRDVDACTEIACSVKPGGQDKLDGAGGGTTVFAGLITTLLCGLLSVFF